MSEPEEKIAPGGDWAGTAPDGGELLSLVVIDGSPVTMARRDGEWVACSGAQEVHALRGAYMFQRALVGAWETFYRARDAYHNHSMTAEWHEYERARKRLVDMGVKWLARDEGEP